MDEAIVKERVREETGLRQRKKDRGSLTRGSWFPRLRSIPPPSLASLSPLHTTLLLVLLFRLVLPRSNNSPSRRLLSFYSVIRLSPFNSLEKKRTFFPRFALSRLHLATSFTPNTQPLASFSISSSRWNNLVQRSSRSVIRPSFVRTRAQFRHAVCASVAISSRCIYVHICTYINHRGKRSRRTRKKKQVA